MFYSTLKVAISEEASGHYGEGKMFLTHGKMSIQLTYTMEEYQESLMPPLPVRSTSYEINIL
jgi:hypothetical protein